MVTVFEYLPDEILLFICQYLRQQDIIQAFFKLNQRLNCTISQYTSSLVVSCATDKQLLSLIGPHLRFLTLKNCNLTPKEMGQASNIEELTLFQTDPDCLPPLPYLTDLNIINGPDFSSILTLFSKKSDLHSVYISPKTPLTMPVFSEPKVSPVKQLAILLNTPKDALNLLRCCPELTCLNLTLRQCLSYETEEQFNHSPTPHLSIFSLRTTYEHTVNLDFLKLFLSCLPTTLEYLSLEIDTDDHSCLDGQVWETYLKQTFPQLIRFEFFFLHRASPEADDYTFLKLSEVLQTFHNSYWSTIVPQSITGYYNSHWSSPRSTCVHTEPIPVVQRRRYFLY